MNHLKQIAAKLPAYGLEAMLVTSMPGEFYSIGMVGEGYILVTEKGCYYSTDSRYIEVASRDVTGCDIHMRTTEPHSVWAANLCKELGLKKVGIEEDYLSVADYNALKACFAEGTDFIPASKLLLELRAQKDEEELELMRKSQEITDRAFTAILEDIKPGVSEQEIAAKLTYYQMMFGAHKPSFDAIVASGPNGSMPHAIPTERKIQEGEFLTMDFGSLYGGYCSDMTRTVAVGQPSDEMVKVYNAVLEAQLTGIAMAKAGVIGQDVHNASEAVLAKHGYAGKMGHGFGHSLGIEIHELPGLSRANNKPMPLNAVVSAEPGIYLPGKFGVRIEDCIVLKEDGCEVLTKSPKNLIIL